MKPLSLLTTLFLSTFLILTSVASAQVTSSGVQAGMGTFADLITTFNKTVVKALGALFMSGAVVGFLYGLARFIWGLREGDTKTISNGRQFMIWSITALFVMFSVYGIIRFFQGLVPGLNQNTITIPEINYGGSSRTNGSPIGNGGTDGSNGTNGSPVGGGGTSQSLAVSGALTQLSDTRTQADTSFAAAECIRFKGKWDNVTKKCTFNSSVVLDPTVTVWDGGGKPCPTGTNYNKQGLCVKVTTPEAEQDKIRKALKNNPLEADNTELDQRYLRLAEGHTKFMYEVNNGQLGKLIENSTGITDEKPNKTMWAMFVLANEPDIVNKVKLFVAAPELYDARNQKISGFVSERNSTDPERSVLALATTHPDKNGDFDTAWAYHVVVHEGAHIPTVAPKIYTDIDYTKTSCSAYLWLYGSPVWGSCFKANTLTSNFVKEFYVRSGNLYSTIQGTEPAYVSEYAKTRPIEDIAETYSSFKLEPKPADDTIANKKILYFYMHDLYGNTKDMTYVKDAFVDAIYAEIASRGKDSDNDGLNDNVELHRGTNPNKKDSDEDGTPDNKDADAEGDGHIDTQNADADGDGKPNYEDDDDDGDGRLDPDDDDDNGDGTLDTRQNSIGDDVPVSSQDTGSGYDPVNDPVTSDAQVNVGTDPFDPSTNSGASNDTSAQDQTSQPSGTQTTDTTSSGFWTDANNDYIPDTLEFWK